MENRPLIRFGPVTKFALWLMTLALITHFFNPMQRTTAWNTEIDGIVKVCVVIILLEAQIDTVPKALGVLGCLVLGTLWWVKSGIRLAGAGANLTGDRLMGPNVTIISNPNYFAYLMVLMIPIYFFCYKIVKNLYLKLFFLGLMGASVFIALRTGSRTGLVAMVCMGLFMLPMLVKEHKKLILIGLLAGVAMIGLIGQGNIERFKTIGDSAKEFLGLVEPEEMEPKDLDDLSAESRLTKIVDTWKMVLRYPILGVGTSPKAKAYEGFPRAAGKVHSEPFMAGRQMGFPGYVLYFLTLYLPFMAAQKMYKSYGQVWPEISEFGRAMRACIVVVASAGLFSPSAFHYPHMLIFLATLSAWDILQRTPMKVTRVA